MVLSFNPRVQNSSVSDRRNSMTSVAYIGHSCITIYKVSCVLLIFYTCAFFKPIHHNATYSTVNNKRKQWDVGLLCKETPVHGWPRFSLSSSASVYWPFHGNSFLSLVFTEKLQQIFYNRMMAYLNIY